VEMPHQWRSLILKGVLGAVIMMILAGMLLTAKSDLASESVDTLFHKNGKIEDITTLYKTNDNREIPCIRVDGEMFEVDHDVWVQLHLGDEISLDYKDGGDPPKALTIRILNQRKFK
jgi:hypothetical protein